MEIADRLKTLARRYYAWVILLLLVVLALHFLIIQNPDKLMIDEEYYVNDARAILAGEGELRGEHPPLGQLLIALSVLMFGDNPLGWRFLSVIFGVAGIGIFYLICRRLDMSPKASFLATFLLAFENMTFIQASIAMLDVFNITFMLAAFWLYLKKNYLLCSVAIALATLVKLSGALTLPAIALHWLIYRRDHPPIFIISMVLSPFFFAMLLPLFDFMATGDFHDPVLRINNMITLTGSIKYTGSDYPYASRPWQWAVQPLTMPYWYDPHYTSAVSFNVWAPIIPTVFYLVYLARKGSQAALFGLCWFASTYLIWIPAQLISDRLTYLFYFYPTVGVFCLGLGLVLSRLIDFWKSESNKKRRAAKIGVVVYLLLHITVFVVLSPHSSAWFQLYNLTPAT
jgi:predicted membrane-bound dolichyl-phosphate-mannose-protein mannosyltransferase